jgi:hypothetical protein
MGGSWFFQADMARRLLSYDELRGLGMAKCGGMYDEVTRWRGKPWGKTLRIGKKGTKRSVAVESHGLPVGIVVSGTNTHDIKLLEETLQAIITAQPEGMNVCLDVGYVGAEKRLWKGWNNGIVRHIRPRGGKTGEENGY